MKKLFAVLSLIPFLTFAQPGKYGQPEAGSGGISTATARQNTGWTGSSTLARDTLYTNYAIFGAKTFGVGGTTQAQNARAKFNVLGRAANDTLVVWSNDGGGVVGDSSWYMDGNGTLTSKVNDGSTSLHLRLGSANIHTVDSDRSVVINGGGGGTILQLAQGGVFFVYHTFTTSYVELSGDVRLSTGVIDNNSISAGSNAFSGTAETDTVTVSGAAATDLYWIQLTGTAAPLATDACRVEALSGSFVVHRSAAGTSDLAYNWKREKP